jgi:hypothetical protein
LNGEVVTNWSHQKGMVGEYLKIYSAGKKISQTHEKKRRGDVTTYGSHDVFFSRIQIGRTKRGWPENIKNILCRYKKLQTHEKKIAGETLPRMGRMMCFLAKFKLVAPKGDGRRIFKNILCR